MTELLKESKTSVKTLCKILKVSHTTVYTYKKSNWLKLDVNQVELIAKHLKVRSKDLVELILRENRKK